MFIETKDEFDEIILQLNNLNIKYKYFLKYTEYQLKKWHLKSSFNKTIIVLYKDDEDDELLASECDEKLLILLKLLNFNLDNYYCSWDLKNLGQIVV